VVIPALNEATATGGGGREIPRDLADAFRAAALRA